MCGVYAILALGIYDVTPVAEIYLAEYNNIFRGWQFSERERENISSLSSITSSHAAAASTFRKKL
jgi:hypothetical protein